MALDARIPMLYDYYREVNGGVLVNNLDLDERIDANYNKMLKLGKPSKNYLTLLDKNLQKIADCYDAEDRYVHGIFYRYLKTVNYTILLDKDNTMVTDELTLNVSLFDSGGYVGIPFNTIKGYDTNEYRIFGYINKKGEKLKTYSYIMAKDFKYVGRYSMEDVIAYVMLDNTDYIEGYIVESKGEGIVSSSIVHSPGTTTGLVYKGEIELMRKEKRVGSRYLPVIMKSELKEFVKQRTIRFKTKDKGATHIMMFKCD